jgi:hypothetical protein
MHLAARARRDWLCFGKTCYNSSLGASVSGRCVVLVLARCVAPVQRAPPLASPTISVAGPSSVGRRHAPEPLALLLLLLLLTPARVCNDSAQPQARHHHSAPLGGGSSSSSGGWTAAQRLQRCARLAAAAAAAAAVAAAAVAAV